LGTLSYPVFDLYQPIGTVKVAGQAIGKLRNHKSGDGGAIEVAKTARYALQAVQSAKCP